MATTTPAPSSSVIGASSYGLYLDTPAQLEKDLDQVVATGATMLRVDLYWATAEQVRGRFDWRQSDRIVTAARARNLQVLLLIGAVPAWARPKGTTQSYPPTPTRLIAPFITAATAHYRAMGVHDWEVFNEVNTAPYWSPRPSAVQYVALLRQVYTAIKAVDPRSVVVSSGLVFGNNASSGSVIAGAIFVEQMYQAGAKGFFDALGIHPYNYPLPPMAQTAKNGFTEVPLVRAVMAANGDGNKPVWATEMGWPTCTDGDYACVSESAQASDMTQAINAWRTDSRDGPFFFYGLRDRSGENDKESRFGFLRSDDSPKPVLAALKHATGKS